MDLHGLVVEEGFHERHDRAAPPGEVVAGPIRVEQAQDRDPEILLVGERQRVVLVVHLRDRVRPALRRRRSDHQVAVLGERGRRVPVDVGRRGDHEVGVEREGDSAGGIHPLDVHLQRPERAPEAGNLLRGQVDDRVAAVEGRGAGRVGACSPASRTRTASWGESRRCCRPTRTRGRRPPRPRCRRRAGARRRATR